MEKKFIDLVISGCDFSGTTTQIDGLIEHLSTKGKKVRDIRGTEIEALFHSERFQRVISRSWGNNYLNFKSFMKEVDECKSVSTMSSRDFLQYANDLLIGNGHSKDLIIASMVHNDITEYIEPSSADAWIMEEPTRRGAGQTVRGFELYRSQFFSEMNPIAAALAHQAYRSEEFFRFRKILREKKKIIIRSRSEESACYQIQDKENLPDGISREQYLSLPGHEIAFGNPPTHIFLVVGPANWKIIDYATLKGQRCGNRILDDHEKNFEYQVMVNHRYATSWIDELYGEACKRYGSKVPEITRFDIYEPKEKIIEQMISKLESIISQSQEKPYISPILEEE